jgi:hypothetical protein
VRSTAELVAELVPPPDGVAGQLTTWGQAFSGA